LLLNERKKYKKKASEVKGEDPEAYKRYYTIQWTYKIIANSFYGYLGFEHSRIHDRRVAASITAIGRYVVRSGLAVSELVLENYPKEQTNYVCPFETVRQMIKDPNPRYKHVQYSDTDSLIVTFKHVIDEMKISADTFIDKHLRKVESMIDEQTRNFLIRLFDLDECYFSLKNEWVASRFLQTAKKKRYAYIEYPSNELVIVGIEVKRSDQPPVLKDWLMDVIRYMLSDDFSVEGLRSRLLGYAAKYRRMINQDRIVEAGKPMAANFSKPNLPQCRAAKNWNELEFQYFKQETRGFYFLLKGIDITHPKAPKAKGQIKDILVPPEVGRVPEYYIIDDDKMVSDYWLKKVFSIVSDVFPGITYDIIVKQEQMRTLDIPTW